MDSKAPARNIDTGLAFRDYNYCEIRYQFATDGLSSWGCVDMGSSMSMIDDTIYETIAEKYPKFTTNPVRIKGVGEEVHTSRESVILEVLLPDISGNRFARIRREFHIVHDMDCGLLIGNDIIEPEGIVIDVAKRTAILCHCEKIVCRLRVTPRKRVSNFVVRCAKTMILAPNTSQTVPIRFPALDMHSDYVFRPYLNNAFLPNGCYVIQGIVSCDQERILVTNVSDKPQVISKDVRLGLIENMEAPQYTMLWPSASEEIGVMFTANPDPSKVPSTIGKKAVSSKEAQKQPPDKTKSRSQLVCINRESDITEEQIR